ncbi:hypothetical protein Pfo_024739, partial [Paulownia fortunei]
LLHALISFPINQSFGIFDNFAVQNIHRMSVNGTTPEKKISPISPGRQQVVYSTSNSKQRRKAATTTTTTTKSRGFCRRLSDCIVMGPAASHRVDLEQRGTKLDQLSQ